jgi:hypothetical protein
MSKPPLPAYLAQLLSGAQRQVLTCDADADQRQQLMRYLALEGMNPRLDEDDDIRFDFHDLELMLLFDKADAENLRLVLPGVDEFDRPGAYEAALPAIHAATQVTKFAKLVVLNGRLLWVAVEMIAPTPQAVIPCLTRACRALMAAAIAYRQFVSGR